MNSPMIKKLCGILDKISSFKAKKRTLIIVFILYIILLSIVAYFHEPWFDEAQAWQISRCASLSDILFKIPHYEGHPPLWHLILLPFAKTGMPYEFSLAFVNIVFSAAAVWIIMFKTKLPDLMRLTLPFTYFFFYQYGVISRPYSVMALALMLCAIFYREKNQKPVRMVLALALLCLSSAYGLAIAAGICVVWLIEEWNGKNIFAFIKDFIKTKTFFCLLGLLIFAVILLILIMPYDDTYAISSGSTSHGTKKVLCNLFYTFFILPYDTTIGAFLIDDTVGITYTFKLYMILYVPISAIIVGITYLFGKKHRCTGLLLIQFVEMPILLALVRMSAHHMGIITLFMIFWICVCFDTGHTEKYGKYDKIMHYIFTFSICIFILIQISWSVISSAVDIKYNYAGGRAMAEYIKENNLENANIMSAWHAIKINDNSEKKYYHFNFSSAGTIILPYFDSNIFPNFNFGRDDMGYSEHRDIIDENEYRQTLEQFIQLDSPEYVFGTIEYGDDDLENVFSQNRFGSFYYVTETIEYCMVFKGNYSKQHIPIYKFCSPQEAYEALKEVMENEGTD